MTAPSNCAIRKRQMLGVAAFEFDVAQAGLGAARLGLFQHLVRRIERHHGGRVRRQRRGDDARSAGDIDQTAAGRFAKRAAEARANVGVDLLGPGCECLCLPGEFVCYLA